MLNNRKFDDAERLFQSALATQDEGIQPKTLYNLGQVRFAQGLEMLKKGPDAQKVTAQGNQALAAGEQALAHGESALADNELSRMIAAYVQGRGARRELREAEKAVQAAMEAYGKTLTRWQRAADDFKGAAELDPSDTNATRGCTTPGGARSKYAFMSGLKKASTRNSASDRSHHVRLNPLSAPVSTVPRS